MDGSAEGMIVEIKPCRTDLTDGGTDGTDEERYITKRLMPFGKGTA